MTRIIYTCRQDFVAKNSAVRAFPATKTGYVVPFDRASNTWAKSLMGFKPIARPIPEKFRDF